MRRKRNLILKYGQIAALVWLVCGWPVCSSAQVDTPAADFTLEDLEGRPHQLSSLLNHPMVMLYFFDADSRPSHAGLISLDKLCAQYRSADLVVWAITRSDREKVKRFIRQRPIGFPILLDSGPVSTQFQADRILPTTCILGPDLKVMDLLHGGGRSNEIMLERLAQRSLQQGQNDFAQAVVQKVVQTNPQNVNARLVGAYAALNSGRLAESESVFARLAGQGGPAGPAGVEGLSAVAARKGQVQKALALARQAEQSDPDRGYVHVIKADVLYSQNKKQAAESEYQKAITKKHITPYHRAKAFNQLARLQADQGRLEQAKTLYDRAVAMNPYYIEATTNKGLIYEEEGRWDKALACYSKAQRIDQTDLVAVTLQKKLLTMLKLENDRAEKSRIDALVKDLAARYRDRQRISKTADRDAWLSRPMVVSILDFEATGGLPERDGFASVVSVQLAEALNVSGRVQVVERVIMEKLLQELNLGSADLADPATALELGHVLSAKLMITGSLFFQNGRYLLTLRLVDTETTRIAKVFSIEIADAVSVPKSIQRLNRMMLSAIISNYPLQGYVMQSGNDQVMINLGAGQGVVAGTQFDIVEPSAPFQYHGRQYQARPKAIGQVEVVAVESDFCQGRILHSMRPVTIDDRLRERLPIQ